jgi:hypothetical protein
LPGARTDEAFADVDKAFALDLNEIGIHYGRGRIHEITGRARDRAYEAVRWPTRKIARGKG